MGPLSLLSVIACIVISLVFALMVARQVTALHELRQYLDRSPGPARWPWSYEISPLGLAYLRGGTVRVGEVALLDLLLSGRGWVRPKDGNITLTDAHMAPTLAKDPVRGATLDLLRHGEWVPAGKVITEVAGKGSIIDALRFDLAGRGLLDLSEEATRLVDRFHATRGQFRIFAVIGIIALMPFWYI